MMSTKRNNAYDDHRFRVEEIIRATFTNIGGILMNFDYGTGIQFTVALHESNRNKTAQ